MHVNIRIFEYQKLTVMGIIHFVKFFTQAREKFWLIEVIILDWKLASLPNDLLTHIF